jgi:hypothetical protein
MSAAKPAAGDNVPFPFDRDDVITAPDACRMAEALVMTDEERAAFGRAFRLRADYIGDFHIGEPTREGAITVDGKPMEFWLPDHTSAEELGLRLVTP